MWSVHDDRCLHYQGLRANNDAERFNNAFANHLVRVAHPNMAEMIGYLHAQQNLTNMDFNTAFWVTRQGKHPGVTFSEKGASHGFWINIRQIKTAWS